MRGRKLYPSDVHPQVDFSKGLRIGQIVAINSEQGTCTLNWFDVPGQRTGVILTQGFDGEYNTPTVGACVICGTGMRDEVYILRYIPANWIGKVQDQSLPPIDQGEKYFESTRGDGRHSSLYLSRTGNVEVETANGLRTGIDDGAKVCYREGENVRDISDAGISFGGKIKRMLGTKFTKVTRITTGRFFTEVYRKIFQYSDERVDLTATPMIELRAGTIVDDTTGLPVTKKALPATLETKEVCVKFILPGGVELYVDKAGRATITGLKLNLNNGSVDADDSDIVLGLETNNPTLGTRGQHLAREHDDVTIPLGDYTDAEHTGLNNLGSANANAIIDIITSTVKTSDGKSLAKITSYSGTDSLKGQITKGSENIIAG